MDARPAPLAQTLEETLGPGRILLGLVAVRPAGDQKHWLGVKPRKMRFKAFVFVGVGVGAKFAATLPALVANAPKPHAKRLSGTIRHAALCNRGVSRIVT